MRRAVAIALVILLTLLPAARAQDDPRAAPSVNRLVAVLSSPELAPGDSGAFRLNLTNPYRYPMQNTSLNVSIYQYATVEGSRPVDASWPYAFPKVRTVRPDRTVCEARECRVLRGTPLDTIPAGVPDNHLVLNFTILTSSDMPHGSVFAEASYFVRFWLEFDFDNGTPSHLEIASRGYFTNAQWEDATNTRNFGPGCTPYNATNRCIGSVNLTRLHVDGIIPDSSFGVREGFPLWPFYGLLVLTGFFLVLAFLFWVDENPGKYPRVERSWLRFKGRLRRLIRRPGAGKV
jgi:hypothetical protein